MEESFREEWILGFGVIGCVWDRKELRMIGVGRLLRDEGREVMKDLYVKV